jgi:predicted alpha/beta-hydrolase family hydrolase
VSVSELETPHGRARVHLDRVPEPRAALVLGHGAGGGVDAPDLRAARDAALAHGASVARVEQPYRVAGRRSPAPASQLDAVWVSVVEQLRTSELTDLPLVVGGRSLGARVACRTVEATGAIAVLCLAFPLVPPRRTGEPKSRLPELEAVTVPMLVVQGASDRFGIPPASRSRLVVTVPGDHGLKADLAAVGEAVGSWLGDVVMARSRAG